MNTLTAIMFAMLLTAGAALAQDGGESAPGGINTGREPGAMPTATDCARGWDPSMRITQAEFNMACDKQ